MVNKKIVIVALSVVSVAIVLAIIVAIFMSHRSSHGDEPSSKPVPILGPIELPKAPHWDPERRCFFFVDVYNSTVHKFDPSTSRHTHAKVGDQPMAFIIPIKNSTDEFIVSYGPNVATIKWDGKSNHVSRLTMLASLGQDVYRANEGKVTPSGSLYIGGHSHFQSDNKTIVVNQTALFVFYKNGATKKVIENVTVANGMAWSADAKKFFFIDSLAYTVESFTYNAQDDTLTDRILLCDFRTEKIPGVPDGMAIDHEDKLWVTSFRGHMVVRIDPVERKIMEQIELDTFQVTSTAFGGPDLKDFYVTSGRFQMSNEDLKTYPHSGYIYEKKNFKVHGRPGVPFDRPPQND